MDCEADQSIRLAVLFPALLDRRAWEDPSLPPPGTLRNGVFTTLALAHVPAEHYTQIRLKLGTGSNVMVGGVTYPLTVSC